MHLGDSLLPSHFDCSCHYGGGGPEAEKSRGYSRANKQAIFVTFIVTFVFTQLTSIDILFSFRYVFGILFSFSCCIKRNAHALHSHPIRFTFPVR